VSLSSGLAARGRIDLADLQGERHYGAVRAYAQSKLAALLFTEELQRRSDQNGWEILSTAAHPGATRTNLQSSGPSLGKGQVRNDLASRLTMKIPGMWQDVDQGVLPALLAATSPDAAPGEYYGPDSFFGLNGLPTVARKPRAARGR
jgi:NAD(P)-dependent dehydrogenase (short-subunit alcohol dehydrogenase family)